MSSQTTKRHLRLVSTDPNDYDLAKKVVSRKGGTVDDSTDVSSILSLILMWPDETQVRVIGQTAQAELTVDKESREVEFLICTLQGAQISVKTGDVVVIRAHLFRQLFEFETKCLEHHLETDATTLILSVPESISVRKQRRLPRLKVDATDTKLFGELKIATPQTSHPVTPIDISLDAISVQIPEVDGNKDANWSTLQVGSREIPLLSVTKKEDRWVLFFDKSQPTHYGIIWEMYRKLAFPNIFPRRDYPPEKVIDTYEKTGYFGKFETSMATQSRRTQMVKTWQLIQEFEHAFTADYVTATERGEEITGASSVTLAFKDEEMPLWVFHQLCAVTSPNLLHHSGQLYTWRAEYLAGRPEDLEAIVWFDSRSRWLERIYVKFANSSESVFLKAAVVYRVKKKNETKQFLNPPEDETGFPRRYFKSEHLLGGMGPAFLNASHILDCIMPGKKYLNTPISESEIQSLSINFDNTFEYTAFSTEDTSLSEDFGTKLTDTDRFCRFNKVSLIDFIASVEHSISVTRMKQLEKKIEAAP